MSINKYEKNNIALCNTKLLLLNFEFISNFIIKK
jgi:hypothetical protein